MRNRSEFTSLRIIFAVTVLIGHNKGSWRLGLANFMIPFLMLSGFVITISLILEYNKTKNVSLKNFYLRRVIRIIPVSYTIIFLILAFTKIMHVRNFGHEYFVSAMAGIFFYASYWSWIDMLQFTTGAFTQLWSLSVEEQFYLIWAPLTIFILRRFNLKILLRVAIVLWLVSTVDLFMTNFVFHEIFRGYFSFDTRASNILCGCFVGIIAGQGFFENMSKRKHIMIKILALLSLVIFLWCVWRVTLFSSFSDTWAFPLVGACWILMFIYLIAEQESLINRFLRLPFMVHLGKITLSSYVWFWAIFLLVTESNTHLFGWSLFIVRLTIIIALSEVTYWLIEVPLHRVRKTRFTVKELRLETGGGA